jgi:hypothetical protein
MADTDLTIGESEEDSTRGEEGSSVRVTDRDLAAIAWIADQFGADYEVLGYLLGGLGGGGVLSVRGVRQLVDRGVQGGLLRRLVVGGRTWVTPTRKGYNLVKRSYPLWSAPHVRLNHCRACNFVRLEYEATPAGASRGFEWISERQLLARRRAGAKFDQPVDLVHVPDAELRRPGADRAWAVEVELTPKSPGSRYVTEVLGRLSPDIVGVRYLCPPQHLERIQTSVEWAVEEIGRKSSLEIQVRPLPVLALPRPR